MMEKVLASAIILGFVFLTVGVEIAERTPSYYQRPRSSVILRLLGILMIGGGLYGVVHLQVG